MKKLLDNINAKNVKSNLSAIHKKMFSKNYRVIIIK